jgi:Mg2+ and Co2+ transporter CorA
MSILRQLPSIFFGAEGGAGTSEGGVPAPASSTPDITHDESGYPGGASGVDDILTPDKFPQPQPTTPADVESIGSTGEPNTAVDSRTETETTQKPSPVDPIAELFSSYEEAGVQPQVPDLPDGVDPKSATGEIFRRQTQELEQLRSNASTMQQKFQQMGYAYDQTVQEMKQQIALMQQQLQAGPQQQQQQQIPPNPYPPGTDEADSYQRLADKFMQQVNQTYDPRVQQMEQRVEQLQGYIQQQHQQREQTTKRQEFLRNARRDLHQTVFEPAGMNPRENPELFNSMMDFTLAIGRTTGQPMASCAKEAERRVMAFAKAYLQARANRSSKAQQTIRSEPQMQPSGGMPLRGEGNPSPELLQANGFNSAYEWNMKNRPPLTRKPQEVEEFYLGDV